MTTVAQVRDFLNAIAPFNAAESYDNVGLLVGNPTDEVTGIAACLDITEDIINETVSKSASLIVSHHPVIFHPMKNILSGSPVYSLVRNKISAIAVHTNFDMSEGGVNDTLMELFGWESCGVLEPVGDKGIGIGAVTELPFCFNAKSLAEFCKRVLFLNDVRYCEGNTQEIRKIGVCGGAGGDLLRRAAQLGCQALITGDIKHSVWIEAKQLGMTLVDAGHYGTEKFSSHRIAAILSRAFPEIPVFAAESEVPPYINL